MEKAKLDELRTRTGVVPRGCGGSCDPDGRPYTRVLEITEPERDALFAYIDHLERELTGCERDWEIENGYPPEDVPLPPDRLPKPER